MKVKAIFLIIALVAPMKDYAQTAVTRAVNVNKGQVIDMHFDYPDLIRVTTWQGDEIAITGSVSINGGEHDDAFLLETSTTGDVIKVNSYIKDIEGLPHRITVKDGEKTIIFKDKTELRKYQEENGRVFNQISFGPDIDIQLEIKVPRNIETKITSVYGIVEVMDFTGPLEVDATYGGVDAALSENAVGELTAETSFGQIYTNLDLKFSDEGMKSRDFYTFVSASPGNGPRYSFESKYGNVYLRKADN